MSGWIIATIVLACYLSFSLLALVINGIEDKWTASNFLSMFLFVFFLPISWPLFVWNAVYEHKQMERKQTANIDNETRDNTRDTIRYKK